MKLNTLIQKVARIGVSYSQKLENLDIETIEDLIYHFPHRYEDFSTIKKVAYIKKGETVCVKGRITETTNTKTKRKKIILTEALFEDETGTIKVIWFNQPYLADQLQKQKVCLAGKVQLGPEGLYLNNPVQEKITANKEELIHTGRIVPVYPETKGVSSRWFRYVIHPLLSQIEIEGDPLPRAVRKQYDLMDLEKALRQIHFPDSRAELEQARHRLAFEELFFIQLSVLKTKLENRQNPSFHIPVNTDIIKCFVQSLPFNLTDDQKKTAWEIMQDMKKDTPMARLLQGDVGAGKTVVAAMAALNTIEHQLQVAFMAPTSVLAHQHYNTMKELLKDFELGLGILTSEKVKYQGRDVSDKKLLTHLEQGEVDLLIGTHSLIQDRVNFDKLGLVIIDEQHRFGTEQRAQLLKQNQKQIPHLLSMTATPIPRSLALTVYGDLDLSTIKQLPAGRKPVTTRIIPPDKREKAYQFIQEQIQEGRQAFVVCPRIESEPEDETIKTVQEEYEKLSEQVFLNLKVAALHGQMKPEHKQKIVTQFRNNEINILVSTSVIEVGVDIPNASVIMIEGAERFGLAQLHQLRGRVGRSDFSSYCLLFTESDNQNTLDRLQALVELRDGFKLAEKDLEIRGPGDVFGKQQWGLPDLAMANLNDTELVQQAREAARNILKKDLPLENHPRLKKKLDHWKEKIHLE